MNIAQYNPTIYHQFFFTSILPENSAKLRNSQRLPTFPTTKQKNHLDHVQTFAYITGKNNVFHLNKSQTLKPYFYSRRYKARV